MLPVCMKYTARSESRVANIARGEAECYICHETLTKRCIPYSAKFWGGNFCEFGKLKVIRQYFNYVFIFCKSSTAS